MSQRDVNNALNRLLTLLARSFPRYLLDAPPFAAESHRQAMETIEQIVADQTQMAQRIAQFIFSNHGQLDAGEYPMDFTSAHDLSVEYILHEAVAYQKQDIAEIEQVVDQVRLHPSARDLAEETLGLAKGHLESLEELLPDQNQSAGVPQSVS